MIKVTADTTNLLIKFRYSVGVEENEINTLTLLPLMFVCWTVLHRSPNTVHNFFYVSFMGKSIRLGEEF